MARLRYNGLSTTLGGSLTSSATSVTFGAALTYGGGTAVPTIAGTDYIPLSILDSTGKLAEVVYLTAYTSGATTGTISRGKEGTTGAARASGLKVTNNITTRDAILGYLEVTDTASATISLASTSITAVNTALDVTINASAGDLIGAGLSGLMNSGNQAVGLAFYTLVSGSRANAVGYDLTASLSGASGVPSWYVSGAFTLPMPLAGEIPYVVQSGDVVSGQVTLRLYYAKSSTTARTINASASFPLRAWVKNYGAVG